ncbi:MAG: hypothetical protein PHP06_10795, partial [Clostridia bacterium]|nr:hypothetical protein [Clostridia bacterium]
MIKKTLKRMISSYNPHSLHTTIAGAFSTLIILIVVSIASISYYVTGNMVEKNSGEYVYQLVKQVN